MSIAGYLDQAKMHKKSFHQRNDSGELDVFEAARYFSGYNEAVGHQHDEGAALPQKAIREDRQVWRGGRMSLDMPMRNALPAQSHGIVVHDKQIVKDHKKYKQPSSPGGRLASFLNSLFNQTAASKKKKSIKSTTQSMKDHEEDQSPGGSSGGRRKRRSSISHFRISTTTTTTTTTDSKSLYSSSSSGFRTPPPYANTPTKSYKDLRSYSDHKQVATLSKTNNNGQVKSNIVSLHNEVLDDKTSTDLAWLDDKFKFSNGLSEKNRKLSNEKSDKDRIWVDRYPSEEKEFRMFTNDHVDIDDGAESDSSSDLFELQNYDLGCCYPSGNLPVYETTTMESITINRGAPISNGIL